MNADFDNAQPPVKSPNSEANTWAMVLHLSMLVSFSGIGIIAPFVIWQIKKDQFPVIDDHGRQAANFMLSLLIYSFVCFLLCFLVIGFFLIPVLGIVGVVFPIIAGIKASSGEVWNYPLTIKFF